jgi:hypothetical protein
MPLSKNCRLFLFFLVSFLEFYFSLFELVLLVPLALVWALLPNDGVAVVANWFIDKVVAVMIELPFSRDMETEADQVGMLMAAKVSSYLVIKKQLCWSVSRPFTDRFPDPTYFFLSTSNGIDYKWKKFLFDQQVQNISS